ncbi:hypothetical protein C2W62_21610 [Candidatus Entotheonella serta]|nr:hypothetical protein C2W62_21610 [Candidatus Entotheonella serta]
MAQNLIVPALPSVVTVSGQVTDALGQPVADAVVKVMTAALEGIPKAATFFATAPTQDDGTYIYATRVAWHKLCDDGMSAKSECFGHTRCDVNTDGHA